MRHIRGTTACRTREQIATALIAFDIDLVAAKDLFADDTNALIIERLPFSQPIGRTQNIQSLLGSEVLLHFTCLIECAELSALWKELRLTPYFDVRETPNDRAKTLSGRRLRSSPAK